MTEPTESTENVHPAALLLPWYVAGTLTDIERQEVEAHLAQCPSCQQELEDVRELKGVLKPHYSKVPGPSPKVFEKVMARIQNEPAIQRQEPTQIREESWISKVDSWLRGLFIPQWAPALAVALIVGQATLLIWMSQSPSIEQPRYPGFPSGQVVERSVPKATESATTINLRLAFKEGASESELRATIENLGGRIVDGPSPDGIYTVAVTEVEPGTLEKKLQELLKPSGIVRIAERAEP